MVDSNEPFVVPEARDLDDEEQRKSSTLNSMYIGTTISKPNVDSIINAVSTILHSQMLEVITNSQIQIVVIPLLCVGRTWDKIKRYRRIVTYSSFQKKNIFSKSQRPLTQSASLCCVRRQPSNRYSTL